MYTYIIIINNAINFRHSVQDRVLRNCNEKDHYPANRSANNKQSASEFCDSNRNKMSNANHRYQNDCDNGQLLRRQYHPALTNILKDEQAMKFRGGFCLLYSSKF